MRLILAERKKYMSCKSLVAGLLLTAITVAVFITYAHSTATSNAADSQNALQSSTMSVDDGSGPRSLALQPEAFKLMRRIGGERFKSKASPVAVLQGVVQTGTDRQNVQIIRSQINSGERVEISVVGAVAPLSWDATSGARTSAGVLDLANRTLLERLTFDSADQFILAQLRGAGYYVVTRNVRPDDAAEDYAGPLWDVVRVDDPEQDVQKKPLSGWRLYYINNKTGLIDRVVSDSQGDRIEANFSGWTDRSGEKFPSAITWTTQGKTVMSFNLTNVSFVVQ